MRPLCLDHLTLSDLTALELIDVAAKTGCASVSLFIKPLPLGPYRDLIRDKAARADVVRALRDTGLGVGIVEPFMLDQSTDWAELQSIVELTAELGGRVNALGFDTDPARLRDAMCRLATLAQGAGVKMAIEAFPLSAVRTQADALDLALAAGAHVGLCVDTLHVIRSGGSWGDVAALPPERILHVQLNDGPLEPPSDRYREATIARMPPGEGEFGLDAFMPLIPPTATVAVEAPFIAPEGMTPMERGRIVVQAARQFVDGI
ncbi:sugar phosphate isomerase/epimerase family protein [Sphingobium vermicomposti]|uniref:sugar phosphate isomerase/epimerase family protein n=1 Tax=Sphingobium vermicomposti TaxID=529005 RepID=UPI001421C2CE|nr:TIM barrel protein [Sphingobium vermicomposti]